MKKNIGGMLVVAAVFSVGAFFSGMSYAENRTPSFGNLPMGANGQFSGNGMQGGATRTDRNGAGNLISGEVIGKDTAGITMRLQNGSTQIILVGSSTQILKSTPGSLDDLDQGSTATVSGTKNSDGSVAAQSIQIR
jgi:hypothetical protein